MGLMLVLLAFSELPLDWLPWTQPPAATLLCAEIEYEGECPTEPLINRYGGLVVGAPLKVGVPVYHAPDEEVRNGFVFHPELMAIYDKTSRSGRDYTLVGPSDALGQYYGWVASEALLTQQAIDTARRNEILPPFVFLQENTPVFASQYLDGTGPSGSGPGRVSTSPLNVSIPYPLFAYARVDEATLLGTTPSLWQGADRKGSSILGWVDTGRTISWKGKMGVKPGKATKLYGTMYKAGSLGSHLGRVSSLGQGIPEFRQVLPAVERKVYPKVDLVSVSVPPGYLGDTSANGWVRVPDRRKKKELSTKDYYLFSRSDLVILSGILQTITMTLEAKDGVPVNLEASVRTAVERYRLFRDSEEETLCAAIKQKAGIEFQNAFFDLPLNRLDSLCESNREECAEFMVEMVKSTEFIKSVIGEYEVVASGDQVRPKLNAFSGVPTRKPYWFSFADGAKYAWIPRHYFP